MCQAVLSREDPVDFDNSSKVELVLGADRCSVSAGWHALRRSRYSVDGMFRLGCEPSA